MRENVSRETSYTIKEYKMNQLYEICICTKQELMDQLLKEYIEKRIQENCIKSKMDTDKIKLRYIKNLNEVNQKSNVFLVVDKSVMQGKMTRNLKSDLLYIMKFCQENNSIQNSIVSLNDIDNALQKFLKKDDNRTDLGTSYLTRRETEILVLIAKGLLNKEIADKLNITERTVKNHISNIFKKINVYDRTQAAVYAIKHKIYVV